MEELSFDNIFGENEINNLFMEETTENDGDDKDTESSVDENPDENDETDKTTEVDPEDLFDKTDEKPESVGSGKKEEVQEQEDSSTDDSGGTSPTNFYSSIANAVAEDGVFPNLDDETVKKAVDAESFSKLFDLEVEARLDDVQLRIKRALDNGVDASDIRKYEGALSYLSKLNDQQITAENEQAEQLRYNLIYQDFINKGMSPERADKLTKRSINAGTDIEDAKEALQNNRDYFQEKYNDLLETAQKDAEEAKIARQKEADKLRDSLLKDKTLLGDLDISTDMRRKVFDSISKPVYKDPESGAYLTSIQKYEQEHRADFLKYVGLFFTLTDGFKDFDRLFKSKVQKEVKKGLSRLEHTLNNTNRNSDGTLRYRTSVKDDPESYIGSFKLDL